MPFSVACRSGHLLTVGPAVCSPDTGRQRSPNLPLAAADHPRRQHSRTVPSATTSETAPRHAFEWADEAPGRPHYPRRSGIRRSDGAIPWPSTATS